MKRTRLFPVVIAALFLVAACSSPSSETRLPSGGVGAGGAASDDNSDREFVHDLAIMNMAEIELSRMALQQSVAADIKAFAQRLVEDHDGAAQKLKSVASAQSIEWPAQLDNTHRELANELAAKQGADFDREYIEAMIDGHENVAARLESRLEVQSLAEWKTAAAGRAGTQALPEPAGAMRDVPLRPNNAGNEFARKINEWAAETYPVVQKHLDTARTLENAIKKRTD